MSDPFLKWILLNPECAPERVSEDAEDGRLRRRRCSPEEGDEAEEEDEEHSCRACRQVFDSLSDLTQHKINQCQLTVFFCAGYEMSRYTPFHPSVNTLHIPLHQARPLACAEGIRRYGSACVPNAIGAIDRTNAGLQKEPEEERGRK
ncbi:hypothetical protein NFI96_000704 [Prochilodus magdalenae]|nr:hypothetical protein NFI96_000704 [Prochilodus magdalenae]